MTTSAAAGTATTPSSRFGAGRSCATGTAWPKHRILFLLAGTFTLAGTVLAASVNRWFALVPGLVGPTSSCS